MRIGISTAQGGQLARPAAVRAVAAAAEQVGYSSLWVVDAPLTSTYTSSSALPPALAVPVLDPLGVLAATAAVTSRVRLGATLHVGGGYREPLLLARALATLDVLSDGRLLVALGGQAVEPVDDALDGLDSSWGSVAGPGVDLLRPVQRPRPPLLVGLPAGSDLDRVAVRADGWSPCGVPLETLASTWDRIRGRAAAEGRDPDTLQLVVRTEIVLTDRPLEGARTDYHGSAEQVADDVEATRRVGASEVVLGFRGDPCLDEALDGYARIAEAASLRGAAV